MNTKIQIYCHMRVRNLENKIKLLSTHTPSSHNYLRWKRCSIQAKKYVNCSPFVFIVCARHHCVGRGCVKRCQVGICISSCETWVYRASRSDGGGGGGANRNFFHNRQRHTQTLSAACPQSQTRMDCVSVWSAQVRQQTSSIGTKDRLQWTPGFIG